MNLDPSGGVATLATPTSTAPAPAAAPAAAVEPRTKRRLEGGAELIGDGVHFRVWAPERKQLAVVIEGGGEHALTPDGDGYWATQVSGLGAGNRYRYRVDGNELLLPDPYSRFQPEGPHGASEVVDPTTFEWTDHDWAGVEIRGQVIYEMHIGTFSPDGTWAGATSQLRHLREVGITVLQVMPVGEFPGKFGWGYDGVDWYAPFHHYGRPDDFRRFVNEAHRLGLAVILDVVYNHFGPDGNYLAHYSLHYFANRETEWGRSINYDGPHAEGARTLAIQNAVYWVTEFHLDGLRLDATQCIFDESADYLVTALTREARAAAGHRKIVIVAENEPQHTKLARPAKEGGSGIDAVYNEDFHHSAVVAATGRREGYYSEQRGSAQELVSAFKHGFLFQGQLYHWQKKRRGQTLRGMPLWAAASFLENHDQVSNSGSGERLWRQTTPGRHRSLTAVLLLGPWTPLLFAGSEWNASTPFFYFANLEGELRQLVRKGRGEFLAQFPSLSSPEAQAALTDPGDQATFERSRLRWDERQEPFHQAALTLHRDLLELRRHDPTIAAQGMEGVRIDGAVLDRECFVIRWLAPDPAHDRLLIVNLGPDLRLVPASEPLLAPPEETRWELLFSTDERIYGGPGKSPPESEETGWYLAGHCASMMRPTFMAARQ